MSKGIGRFFWFARGFWFRYTRTVQRPAAVFWGAWLLAFAAIGAWQERAHFRLAAPALGAPDGSLDDVLQNFLRVGADSRDLRALPLAGPADRPVLLLGPGADWTMGGVHFALSYALWPRPVWASGKMRDGGGVSPYTVMPASGPPPDPAMLVIYRLTPPPELALRAHWLSASLCTVLLPVATR